MYQSSKELGSTSETEPRNKSDNPWVQLQHAATLHKAAKAVFLVRQYQKYEQKLVLDGYVFQNIRDIRRPNRPKSSGSPSSYFSGYCLKSSIASPFTQSYVDMCVHVARSTNFVASPLLFIPSACNM
jgi:hypothetical protein